LKNTHQTEKENLHKVIERKLQDIELLEKKIENLKQDLCREKEDH
jgi:hypothetical protein